LFFVFHKLCSRGKHFYHPTIYDIQPELVLINYKCHAVGIAFLPLSIESLGNWHLDTDLNPHYLEYTDAAKIETVQGKKPLAPPPYILNPSSDLAKKLAGHHQGVLFHGTVRFLGAKSTSIRDCVGPSVRPSVRPPRCAITWKTKSF
jgi:hypothetical protein